MYSITKNTTTAGQAGIVCGSNRISGRKQKPTGIREEVLSDILYWNPFHLWNGGCQDGDTTFSLLNSEAEVGYALKFASTSQLSISYNHNVINLLFPFTFINDEPLPAGIYRFNQAELKYLSDQRRLFSVVTGVAFGTFYSGTREQYTFGVKYRAQDDNFNINSRFQWRFRPMSDLYIVYTDNYAVEFWGPKHRALVIKLNYWFNL